MTIAMVAPTSTCGTFAGTGISAPSALQVFAGLMYSTGAFGGALYGGSFTLSPSASSSPRKFNRVPYTVPVTTSLMAAPVR